VAYTDFALGTSGARANGRRREAVSVGAGLHALNCRQSLNKDFMHVFNFSDVSNTVLKPLF
jgi:hypothetical protein